MTKICIKSLKSIMSKLKLAVEKNKLNPISGWVGLSVGLNNVMSIKVSNFSYYVEAELPVESSVPLLATVQADTFISLVSKLDEDYVTAHCTYNTLVFETAKSEYTFPLIKEMGTVKVIDKVFYDSSCEHKIFDGKDISSIATVNTKGLTNLEFARDIQQFICFDELGAITFVDNIYINSFKPKNECEPFRVLLSDVQAKLLKVFDNAEDVELVINNDSCVAAFVSDFDGIKITVIIMATSSDLTSKFPCQRLRQLADKVSDTHIVLDKKSFEKSLNRLMVFDKKFDITVLNYSKIVFGENGLKLVSIRNKNSESLRYLSSQNACEHESIIRFADLLAQVKAIPDNELDISYGDSTAIVINSGNLRQLIPEIHERD